jgi:hypothetical protein
VCVGVVVVVGGGVVCIRGRGGDGGVEEREAYM